MGETEESPSDCFDTCKYGVRLDGENRGIYFYCRSLEFMANHNYPIETIVISKDSCVEVVELFAVPVISSANEESIRASADECIPCGNCDYRVKE